MSGSKIGLVLPGGGARGAFQVGVLKAIAEILPGDVPNPFPILSGTSAGAINSAVLASRARRFRSAVDAMEAVWAGFRSEQVFRTDALTMLKSSLHWLAAIVLGGLGEHNPRSLLDNDPLRSLLSRNIRFPRIQTAIDRGHVQALAITAAGYQSARSVTFFQASPGTRAWQRTRRIGVRCTINLDHLMASIAVPLVFPPACIRGEYYGDGAMRHSTPLSPAVHLGADRILVIGIRDETPEPAGDPHTPPIYPSFGHIAGYMLDTLFLDGLYSDLERLSRINDLIDSIPEDERTGPAAKMRPIDTMIVIPSEEIREIAASCRKAAPVPLRALMRGLGGPDKGERRLLSYLLFESEFTRALIDLGYRDAMKIRDELEAFVRGADVPRLFAPSWMRRDLAV
ncbi:patatin-like phospholipase family protein [Lentisalinibacter orientalis]|uniref:patatin-like phospholipase family protein n=1 Tax=Lentisalinibacter orientalis TaxID=2992241 RepID=UPI003863CA2E